MFSFNPPIVSFLESRVFASQEWLPELLLVTILAKTFARMFPIITITFYTSFVMLCPLVRQDVLLVVISYAFEQFQIFNSVVGFIPIDVVNNLSSFKKPTKMLLHNQTMLSHKSTLIPMWMIFYINFFIAIPSHHISISMPIFIESTIPQNFQEPYLPVLIIPRSISHFKAFSRSSLALIHV